ncbi:hypothetical protein SAMN00777080_1141 [Aquiflexum balticum DSM 16537]|uniref:Seryl-tRNA synthetase n=1 Tax=Aquiflexum balticum DSM 16537 TaxID=758820 RepID=A0A1W2H126_9BACT|nr:hypothetical protein [Aquiflexum balticum]SMD42581.1 hypothetical protein SAMN00777080_1141 [Aquiflexum balticum DSM 16537]
MRKPFLTLATAAALIAFTGITVEAMPFKSKEPKVLTMEESERLLEIESRVLELKEMDLTVLSKEEKKELKDELRSLEKEAKAFRGTGIYISTGALIIIILLIILL